MCSYAKVLNYVFLYNITLAWPPSNVKLNDVVGSNNQHSRHLRSKMPRNRLLHGMLVTFTLVAFCYLTFTLLTSDHISMNFVLMQYAVHFLDKHQHLVEFELFAVSLTDPRA